MTITRTVPIWPSAEWPVEPDRTEYPLSYMIGVLLNAKARGDAGLANVRIVPPAKGDPTPFRLVYDRTYTDAEIDAERLAMLRREAASGALDKLSREELLELLARRLNGTWS